MVLNTGNLFGNRNNLINTGQTKYKSYGSAAWVPTNYDYQWIQTNTGTLFGPHASANSSYYIIDLQLPHGATLISITCTGSADAQTYGTFDVFQSDMFGNLGVTMASGAINSQLDLLNHVVDNQKYKYTARLHPTINQPCTIYGVVVEYQE